MLSVAKAAKDYYLQKLGEVSPREDYYLRGGLATGTWRGAGAAELGLEGTVSAQGLVRLFDGEHPATGEQLGRRLRRDGVAAWDVTFSADKSVSLLWALGDEHTRQQVFEAFDEATTEAFGYLESVASATRGASKTPMLDDHGNRVLDDKGRTRFHVETWPIATSGYVAASFTEFTSRADDPQLHTHVVIANKVRGEDGVWRTIDGRLLFRYQLAAGYLHEAVLRRELTQRLGVRWQPVHNGMADIDGFTRRHIDTFSQRRQHAEIWRREQGLPDTAAARQAAVLATRSPKQDRHLEDLRLEWTQRAAEMGLTRGTISQMLGHSRQTTSPDPETLFANLASPDGLTARASTFAAPEVVKDIAAALPEGGTRHQIETLADTFLTTEPVVPLHPAAGTEVTNLVDAPGPIGFAAPGESVPADAATKPMRRGDGRSFPSPDIRRYSTAELLATEQRIINLALAGVDTGRWTAPRGLVEAQLRRHPHLTDGQRQMMHRFATSGNSIDVGVGPAGSGKTAVMAVIHRLAVFTATPIVGAALAAKAAAGLQTATGIPSTTLARLLSETSQQRPPAPGTVVVVDEAGMVGTRQLAAVCDLVDQTGGKLILIGDHHQLPEIDAGGLFRALANRLPSVELTDNIRQHQPWERVALAELRNGSADAALQLYRDNERLNVGDHDQMITQAVDDWHQHVTNSGDPTSGLLIAHDNDTVTELNRRARTSLAASGRLHGPDLDTADRTFQAGDRILCRHNQPRLDVLNGDLATVDAVDVRRGTLTVRLDRDPEPRQLPAWYLKQGHVDHGYALTGHKAQGVTTGRTFAITDGRADREWLYVALSRGRQANSLYLADPEPCDEPCTHLTHPDRGDAIDTLATSLGRSTARTAAIDHSAAPRPGSDETDRVDLMVAHIRAQRHEQRRRPPGIGLATGR
jgi:conjugative relaxase-like TrwC/TraI family protein